MSPSKMRRSQWYQEGQTAFHCATERDPTPNPYEDDAYGDRRACWALGFQEAKEEEARRVVEATPTPVQAILASVTAESVRLEWVQTGDGKGPIKRRQTKAAVASAIGAAETVEDLRDILDVLVEELLP